MFISVKNEIEEHGGFKIGDRVKVKIVAGPDGIGKIQRIYLNGLMGVGREEMCFEVGFRGEGGSGEDTWSSIFLNELEKVNE